MIFDGRARTDQDAIGHGETDWAYLNRSGRTEAERVRCLLTEWLYQYPEAHRTDVASRIRGGDDTEFQAATFELLVFSALTALGCSVEVHPHLASATKHPDFLATTPAGERVYVEATLASEFSQEVKSARRRTKAIYDAVEKVESPDFFIHVSPRGNPHTPPSGRRLRHELRRWISNLDYFAVRKAAERGNRLPTFIWEHEGWKIRFKAVPKKPERRGKGQRTIGSIFHGVGWSGSRDVIRAAVRGKGGRYGELPHPLLIAINVDAISVHKDDEVNALLGDEQYVVSMDDPSAEPRQGRAPNGAWLGARGPEYTRVSGAWIFRRVTPWSITSRSHTVYFNPFAANRLPSFLDVLPRAKGANGLINWAPGLTLSDLFCLPSEWPETQRCISASEPA